MRFWTRRRSFSPSGASAGFRFVTSPIRPGSTTDWSIAMYDRSYNLIENPINRYSIGDRSKGLQFSPDGSLTIHIQSDSPEEGIFNWLPSPKGENFRMTFRMYKPRKVMFNPRILEDYLPPVVER